MRFDAVLNAVCDGFEKVLGEKMTGFYVHGSIGFGCFDWDRSDIDFIVVVSEPLDRDEKLRLLAVLDQQRPSAPPKGFEMSVVLYQYCQHFVYPTPYELHFSNAWLSRYQAHPLTLCGDEPQYDPDLAAHFMVIQKAGMVWRGLPIASVFGEVPRDAYIESIYADIKNAPDDVRDAPVYVILNLCRVYAFLKDGCVLSKAQGGQWGIKNLPADRHAVICWALEAYTRGDTGPVDTEKAAAFCHEMLKRIQSLMPRTPAR